MNQTNDSVVNRFQQNGVTVVGLLMYGLLVLAENFGFNLPADSGLVVVVTNLAMRLVQWLVGRAVDATGVPFPGDTQGQHTENDRVV